MRQIDDHLAAGPKVTDTILATDWSGVGGSDDEDEAAQVEEILQPGSSVETQSGDACHRIDMQSVVLGRMLRILFDWSELARPRC